MKRSDRAAARARTGLAPSAVSHSLEVVPRAAPGYTPLDYNSTSLRQTDFQFELFPLHSPLLWESLLVSFPPLSYMLKSSGSSYLISGRGCEVVENALRCTHYSGGCECSPKSLRKTVGACEYPPPAVKLDDEATTTPWFLSTQARQAKPPCNCVRRHRVEWIGRETR